MENRADVYAHVTAIKKWDLCAGYAILNALGGTMTTLNGEFIDFSGHTDPLNTKGILAYMTSNHVIEQLKTIRIKE
jgi:inositol monophosphatase 3